MKKRTKPKQIENLFQLIRECIDRGQYVLTEHAVLRLNQRDISLTDTEFVLKNGYHEKKKTYFDEIFNTWRYAIRGKTVDDLQMRIIISFNDDNMIIITVMHVGREVKP